MTFFSIALVLFLIMDPFGNIATFLNLLQHLPPKRRRWVVLREMGFALITMLFFFYLGKLIMSTLQVTAVTVHIASGVILFLAAIRILFPGTNSLRMQLQNGLGANEEPFVVPLAIPLIAGPSLLATIILYSQLVPDPFMLLAAIFAAWLCSSIVLFFGPLLQRILTNNGLIACERLMGMVLVLLAIQRFLEGIQHFVAACKIPPV